MRKIFATGLIFGLLSSGAYAADVTTSAACPEKAESDFKIAKATADTETCICDGFSASKKSTVNGGAGAVVATADQVFVKAGFDVQCSANTYVSYNEITSTTFAVAAGSKKGNQTYIGTTKGGAVTTSAKCSGTSDACTAANITTALTAATTEAKK